MPDSNSLIKEQTASDQDNKTAYQSLVGHKAPVFSARSTLGDIALDQFKGQWVILFFHPADFTPVCTTEFIRLAQRKHEFDALNTQLIGVSIDSIYAHMAWVQWMERHYNVKIAFPIVEDISMNIANAYGLVTAASTSTSGARVCCFINPEGEVSAMIHYPMQLGRSIDELLRVQTALIEIEKTGMTCPVDWEKGNKLLQYPTDQGVNDPAIEQSRDWLKEAIQNFDQ